MRMNFAVALILLSGSLTAYAADLQKVRVEDGLDFAVPSNSPVSFTSLGQYGVASFTGRFAISGTYHYGYVTDDPEADASYGIFELYFLPDKKAAARLPYWLQRGAVHEMRLTNENAFVKAVIAPESLEALKRKDIFSVEGRVSIVVEGYQASVECDYPTYSVTFVSLERHPTMLASKAFVEQYGC